MCCTDQGEVCLFDNTAYFVRGEAVRDLRSVSDFVVPVCAVTNTQILPEVIPRN